MSTRTVVLTGSAAGIGAATRARMEGHGWRVIGVNRRGGEIRADLSTAEGRARVVEGAAALVDGHLDAVIANAALISSSPAELIIRTNFFGTVAIVEGLRPLLAAAPEPRALVVGSLGMLSPADDGVVEACLAGDEELAVKLAVQAGSSKAYMSSKRALARWMRRRATTPDWAGAGIPLNLVAPGIVDTESTARDYVPHEEKKQAIYAMFPMPLGGYGTAARPDQWAPSADQVAPLFEWMVSPENSMMTGQIIFIDSGAEASNRGETPWIA